MVPPEPPAVRFHLCSQVGKNFTDEPAGMVERAIPGRLVAGTLEPDEDFASRLEGEPQRGRLSDVRPMARCDSRLFHQSVDKPLEQHNALVPKNLRCGSELPALSQPCCAGRDPGGMSVRSRPEYCRNLRAEGSRTNPTDSAGVATTAVAAVIGVTGQDRHEPSIPAGQGPGHDDETRHLVIGLVK